MFRRQTKTQLFILVAVLSATVFFSVTVAHACIAMAAAHDGHHHGGIGMTTPMPMPHNGAEDETCRFLRDRFVSVTPEAPYLYSFASDLHAAILFGRDIAELRMHAAERPPGENPRDGDPLPLYLFNAVLRI